ncbi:MAG TPA: hypothetical protein PKE69_08525 [Pyrinomonadaceae bacterium]|nr:hypothetical protein [Pyrinomonadaceae bacterium]
MIIVYWSARNVQHYLNPGNHHFVLVTGNSELCMEYNIAPRTHNGMTFFTLAAFKDDAGNMVFGPNDSFDVRSVRERLDNPGWYAPEPNWDFQGHEVNSPNGCSHLFAKRLLTLSANFDKNSQTTPIPFKSGDRNCATWVNTLFKVAGVPYSERLTAGEFSGIDMGEEEYIPEKMFK